MTARDRVLAACDFRRPDRIPRFDEFWEYPDAWRQRLGPPELLTDVKIHVPDEGVRPTWAGFVKQEGGWIYERDTWGRTIRRKPDAYFVETLEVAMPPGTDPDKVRFDPPDMDERFLMGRATLEEAADDLAEIRRTRCVFGKTGGPFLRTTYVRGETQFLTDIATDPPLARAIADRVADLLMGVGLEEIRRWDLRDTGIWIFDDMAHNGGPFVGPPAFERIFLPAYRRMIRAYKDAGARYVGLHSDGDIRLHLDMLIDAGIDAINPVERRAGMDIFKLREKYPKLILTGGMCNTDVLVNGPVSRIEAETRKVIDLGRHGGVVIGTHSISPEVPLEHFVAYHETCLTYGVLGG